MERPWITVQDVQGLALQVTAKHTGANNAPVVHGLGGGSTSSRALAAPAEAPGMTAAFASPLTKKSRNPGSPQDLRHDPWSPAGRSNLRVRLASDGKISPPNVLNFHTVAKCVEAQQNGVKGWIPSFEYAKAVPPEAFWRSRSSPALPQTPSRPMSGLTDTGRQVLQRERPDQKIPAGVPTIGKGYAEADFNFLRPGFYVSDTPA
eukprot:TRINITY_DN80553_c0_g1_i1.p1 TRINITY_DN80553_c0_g1~~TRINITY_DN80553_c0_g1_i1.p1  ORF type:complete len:205 (-),score=38.66 TRINITY_DN80553_c0_g1_i1:162-776(-)